MPLKRKLLLLGAPLIGGAAIGAVMAFSGPVLAASPSPSPPASSSPSTTTPASPAAPAPGGSGTQHHCPNM